MGLLDGQQQQPGILSGGFSGSSIGPLMNFLSLPPAVRRAILFGQSTPEGKMPGQQYAIWNQYLNQFEPNSDREERDLILNNNMWSVRQKQQDNAPIPDQGYAPLMPNSSIGAPFLGGNGSVGM